MRLNISTCLALVAFLGAVHYADQVEAFPKFGLGCASNFIVGWLSDRMVESNPMVANFQDTTKRIMERVNREVEEKNLEDKVQIEALYHKIAIDEIHKLKDQLEAQKADGKKIEDLEKELTAQTEALDVCQRNADQNQALDIDEDKELEKEEEKQLSGDIQQAEAEMGAGLSGEDMKVLQEKTRALLNDLLQNEVRQLALSCMAAYANGSAMGPILQAFGAVIKAKLAKYFMATIFELFGSALGRSFQPQPLVASSKPRPGTGNEQRVSTTTTTTTTSTTTTTTTERPQPKENFLFTLMGME